MSVDEVFKSVRNMFANHAVAELHCKTSKLIDKDGVTLTHDYHRCAELILQAYME